MKIAKNKITFLSLFRRKFWGANLAEDVKVMPLTSETRFNLLLLQYLPKGSIR